MTGKTLTIARPDDWHLHFRDGTVLADVVPATARVFARAICMPNLVPAVTTSALAREYRARIRAAVPANVSFEPLMVLYLTDHTDPADIRAGKRDGTLTAAKLYPAGATTNSHGGVTALEKIFPVLEAMQEVDLPLLVHGEVTEAAIDVFDREKVFIERHLQPVSERFPALRIVFEHITTADAAQFVLGARAGIAATITPQHLLMNRNDLFTGGLRPHNYCLPVLKRRTHQEMLQKVAVSGDPRFFLGTDSAPHARHAKENACGCAGCYSAPAALPLYAEFFDQAGALDRLEGFASHFGPDFYRLPRNTQKIMLKREAWTVPERLSFGGGEIVPFWAGRELQWQVAE